MIIDNNFILSLARLLLIAFGFAVAGFTIVEGMAF